MGCQRHIEEEVLASRLAIEREGELSTLRSDHPSTFAGSSTDSGTSAVNSTDSIDADSIDTDSFDSSRTLRCNFDLRKKTSALRVRGKVLRRSDVQQV